MRRKGETETCPSYCPSRQVQGEGEEGGVIIATIIHEPGLALNLAREPTPPRLVSLYFISASLPLSRSTPSSPSPYPRGACNRV